MDEDEPMTFGRWLHNKRREAFMSMDDLSDKSGCSKNYISVIEREIPSSRTGRPPRPSRDVAIALAKGVGGDVEYALELCGYVGLTAYPQKSPIDPVYRTIGIKLRKLREDRGLMQKHIAKKLDVSPEAMTKYENGQIAIPVDKLRVLAKFYKLPLDYFVEDDWRVEESQEAEYIASYRGAPEQFRESALLLLKAAIRKAEAESGHTE